MRPFVILCVAAIALFRAGLAHADAGAATTNEGDTLVHDVEQILAARHVPGAAFSIVDHAGMRAFAAGFADLEAKRPATRDTPFRVASVSKLLVPLVVLALVEEGRITLETKVRDVLPSLTFVNPWEAESPLRIVHLLEGTTGWDDLRPAQFSLDRPTRSPLADVLALDPRPLVSRWPPGAYASYANAGPTAAAAIVEKLTDEPYETVVQKRVFAPLAMTRATFETGTSPTVARAYTASRAPLDPHTVLFRPSAGLAASAVDMGNLLAFFVAKGSFEGKTRLSHASLARMLTASSTPGARAGLATAYALCIQTEIAEGRVWRGHRGGFEGTAAALFFDPAREVGYFLALDVDDDEAFEAIARRLRDELERGTSPALLPPRRGASVAVEPGFYAVKNPRFERADAAHSLLDLTYVTVDHDTLEVSARSAHPARGRFVGADGRGYRRPEDPVTTLVAREDGALETAAVALVPLPLGSAVVRIGALVLVAIALGSAVAHAALLLLVFLWKKRRFEGPTSLRLLPVIAVGALALGLVLWAATDVASLGRPSPRSVLLLVASSVLPLATVGALATFVVAYRSLGRASKLHLGVTLAALALVCAHLGRYGLLFVRPWD